MKASKSTIDVNEQFVGVLLSPLWWGGRSHPEMIEVDPNDEIEIRKIIRAEIVPHFSNYKNESQHKIKDSLRWLLNIGEKSSTQEVVHQSESLFVRIFSTNGYAIELPNEPKDFYFWLWDELFGSEKWQTNTDHYRRRADTAFINSLEL